MSSSLDMSLDEIIRKNRGSGGRNGNFRGRGRGRGSGSFLGAGPDRRLASREPIRPNPYPIPPPMQMPTQIMFPSGGPNRESETKLYISNLDYDVTNEDIKILFSEVGELKRYSIHYDRIGRSKGTAEVVFVRQTDALAAIKRYNNVLLDGKPMNIELVGVSLLASVQVPLTASGNMGNHNSAFRSGEESIGVWGRGRGRGDGVGRGCGRGHGRGFTGDQGQQRRYEKSAEELDAELEKYRLEAMQIN